MTTIDQRMKALRIEMPPDIEARHLAAIAHELRTPPTAHVSKPSRTPALRRLATLAATAVVVLVPVAALGAEGSVPGDLLYPVKQSTEWVRSLADPDVRGIHRVEELEIVIERGAPIEVVAERLADATEAAADSPALMARVDRAREQARERYGSVGDEGPRRGGDVPTDDEDTGADTSPTTTAPGSIDRNREGAITPTTLDGMTTGEGSPGTTVRSQDRNRSGSGGSPP